MPRSTKRLALIAAAAVLAPAAALAGLYYTLLYQHSAGPRTVAPKELIREYDGPGSVKRAGEAPPADKPGD